MRLGAVAHVVESFLRRIRLRGCGCCYGWRCCLDLLLDICVSTRSLAFHLCGIPGVESSTGVAFACCSGVKAYASRHGARPLVRRLKEERKRHLK